MLRGGYFLWLKIYAYIWYNVVTKHGKPCFLFEKIYEENIRSKN
nr:MAG TPA: L protein, polymerase, putative cap-binding, viral [Caudoviricetes sp.]